MTHQVINFDPSGYNNIKGSVKANKRHVTEIMDMLARNEPVYVQFHANQGVHRKRETGIARVHSIQSCSHYVQARFVVCWDDRPNKVNVDYGEVAWLKGYQGPTVWKWTVDVDDRPQVSEVKDRLGETIHVGDFVSFAFNTSGELDLMLGKVTKITDKGDVYCLNQEIGTETKHQPAWMGGVAHTPAIKERLIRDPSKSLMVMTNDLMDRILMAKLAK